MSTHTETSFDLGRLGSCAAALVFSCFASIAYATPSAELLIEGPAITIDGDTLEIAGFRVRLEGIDAPELSQTCKRANGESWACGLEAQQALEALVADKSVACDGRGLDKYGRQLGQCFVDGDEINGFMVSTGYARAFVKYSTAYVDLEEGARAAGAGLWQGEAQAPWVYRHAGKTVDVPAQGCRIKGNISRHGQIYHLPSMPWYAKVTIDPARGERWFCSETEAQAAGWRASGNLAARR